MRKTNNNLLRNLTLSIPCILSPISAHAWHPGHDEHASKHGGKVISIGDAHQHVEIVTKPDHQYDVYFSDAAQHELPAAKFSRVALHFSKRGTVEQTLQLHLSDDGEYWTGSGGPSDTSSQTIVKIECAYGGAALSKEILLFSPATHAHTGEKTAH